MLIAGCYGRAERDSDMSVERVYSTAMAMAP